MNDQTPPSPAAAASLPGPPPLPAPAPASRGYALTPMGDSVGLASAIEALLKHPGSAVFEFVQGTRALRLSRSLLIILVIGLGLFGMVSVDFSHGIQWWAAPLKLIAGLFLSALLCLPSLYIFSCLGGLEIRFKTAMGLLLSALSISGLLLAGFTPVVWVFSQSSGSLPFVGAIMILIWSLSLAFGFKGLSAGARALGLKQKGHLRIWMVIFALVTLQMSCALRPLLGEATTFLPTSKKFFLQHWNDELNKSSLD